MVVESNTPEDANDNEGCCEEPEDDKDKEERCDDCEDIAIALASVGVAKYEATQHRRDLPSSHDSS